MNQIVRAVNAHDAMVKALKQCRDLIEHAKECGDASWGRYVKPATDLADAALALAEGK